MIFRKTLRGKLLSRETQNNGTVLCQIETEDKKVHTLSFEKGEDGSGNVGEEIYAEYNNTPFKKIKKGKWLTNSIYLANKKVSRPFYKYTRPAIFLFLIPFIVISTSQFYMTLYNVLPYMWVLGLSIFAFFGLSHALGQYIKKDTERFIIEKPTKKFFIEYVEQNFSKKDRFLNRKLKEEEKTALMRAVSSLDTQDYASISSTLRFEYQNIIDNNNLTINDIKKLEYYRQKMNIENMSHLHY